MRVIKYREFRAKFLHIKKEVIYVLCPNSNNDQLLKEQFEKIGGIISNSESKIVYVEQTPQGPAVLVKIKTFQQETENAHSRSMTRDD